MTTDPLPPPISLHRLFAKFLGFGCLAFGGPVAQIAMIRDALVDKEQWISQGRFNRLLAVMQILPGPEAHELCVHLGMMARGRIGGLLAGLGFMLPGLVLMLAAAWLYVHLLPAFDSAAAALLGVQIAVLAIIARAVQRIATHVLEGRWLWLLAAASFLATLVAMPFWLVLAAAGLLCAFPRTKVRIAVVAATVGVALLWHFMAPSIAQAGTRETMSPDALALFVAGLKGGLLTFGGAYTAIPYVRADTVGRGWLSDASFLDGVALAGTLPAPLVIFATFIGYVVGGFSGALAITVGMFLPAFAFSLIFFERLEGIVENPALHRFLGGVAAAVVGIIAVTLVQLAWSVFDRLTLPAVALTLFAGALLAVWRLKGVWVVPAVIGLAALAGWALSP